MNFTKNDGYDYDRYYPPRLVGVHGPWDAPLPEPEPPDWWLDLKAGLCIGGGASAVILLTVGLAILWLRAERLWP